MIVDKMFAVNLAANGNSPSYVATGRPQSILPYGTGFGGGTLTLKASLDAGTTWVVLGTSVTWTSATLQTFTLAKGTLFRLELTGSTAPDLNARLAQDDSNA